MRDDRFGRAEPADSVGPTGLDACYSPTEGQRVPASATDSGDDRLLLTLEEAARRLSIGRTMIYELAARGVLQTVTIGRCRRVPVGALWCFVDRLICGGQAELPCEPALINATGGCRRCCPALVQSAAVLPCGRFPYLHRTCRVSKRLMKALLRTFQRSLEASQ